MKYSCLCAVHVRCCVHRFGAKNVRFAARNICRINTGSMAATANDTRQASPLRQRGMAENSPCLAATLPYRCGPAF